MNVVLGRTGILLALVASVVGIATIAAGLVRRRPSWIAAGRTYAYLAFAGAVLATVAIQHALITHDFRIAYVATNNSRQTPLLYDVTGMWSALRGSLLFWGLILTGYGALLVTRFRRRAAEPFMGWATLVMLGVTTFFFAVMAGPANPFALVSGKVPTNGPGPNPLLQDRILVAFHPPLLYLGFVGFTVPFAFAVAALATGRVSERWQLETRSWTLAAWVFLTMGIVLGMWWSYQVLGWGGFWGWDPVENVTLLPWLCGTAYLHSTMAQERRGLLRVWNVSLVVATFTLTIFGTFLDRSGVIQSVHNFSTSNLGGEFLALLFVVMAVGVGLIAWRGDLLRGEGGIAHPLSREGAFLLNNVVFAAFAVIVLVGTVFPIFVQAFAHQAITVGAPYFDATTLPIVLALLFLMAVAPVLPWRRTTSETLLRRLLLPGVAAAVTLVACVATGITGFELLVAFALAAFAAMSAFRSLVLNARASRRAGRGVAAGLLSRSSGGMVVHLGVVAVAIAMASATNFGHRGQITLYPGRVGVFDHHRLVFERAETVRQPSVTSVVALVDLDGHRLLRPALSRFGADLTWLSSPSIASGPRDDVYLTLVTPPTTTGGPATIGVIVQPLIAWIWGGAGIMMLGALIASLPRRRRRSEPGSSATSRGASAGSGAGSAGGRIVAEPGGSRPPVGVLGARRIGPMRPARGSAP